MSHMSELNVALDIEGVLADSHTATGKHVDFPMPDETGSWSFPTEEQHDEFMHVSQNLWHNHWDEIPPEPQPDGWDLGWATTRLNRFHQVDVVTSRTGVDASLRLWLNHHDVYYDTLHVTDDPRADKTDYGNWQVIVDDAVHNAEKAIEDGRVAIVVDKAYNRDWSVSEEYARHVRRVSDVTEAARILSDPDYVSGLPLP